MKLYKDGGIRKGDVFPLEHYFLYRLEKTKRISASSIKRTMAIYQGVKRPPKKGEFYLSGAAGYVTAYRAEIDLSTAYPIAELIRVTISEIVRVSVTKA